MVRLVVRETAITVRCPRCGAPAGTDCSTSSGKVTLHIDRRRLAVSKHHAQLLVGAIR